MNGGRGHIGTPPLQNRTGNTQEMAKHKYERRKPALKAHVRALEVVWHTQYRPSIKRRLRALQRQIRAFITK